MTAVLDQLQMVLVDIRTLGDLGRERFMGDRVTRLAVERLWIHAGNLAEDHRLARGLDIGAEPWAELHRYRNWLAHARPDQVNADRVWDAVTDDLRRLLAAVRAVA